MYCLCAISVASSVINTEWLVIGYLFKVQSKVIEFHGNWNSIFYYYCVCDCSKTTGTPLFDNNGFLIVTYFMTTLGRVFFFINAIPVHTRDHRHSQGLNALLSSLIFRTVPLLILYLTVFFVFVCVALSNSSYF